MKKNGLRGVRVPSGALDTSLGWVSVHGLLDDPLKNSNKEKDHCRSTKDFEKIAHLSLSCEERKERTCPLYSVTPPANEVVRR